VAFPVSGHASPDPELFLFLTVQLTYDVDPLCEMSDVIWVSVSENLDVVSMYTFAAQPTDQISVTGERAHGRTGRKPWTRGTPDARGREPASCGRHRKRGGQGAA